MKFIDLSGYMFSGKAAISDLIRECEGFHVHHYRSEFDLLRVPHGLLDLKHALIDDWSWVRSDKALREFIKVIEVMGRTPKGFLEKLCKPGFGYSNRFPNFTLRSRQFITDITDNKWSMRWPYEAPSLSPLTFAKLRVISKLTTAYPWPVIDYHLCSGDQFINRAKSYLYDLLTDGVNPNESHTVVTHNMLEPYNPEKGFCFFDNIKSIVIDRDVRDIYMTSVVPSLGFNDIVHLNSRIIGAFDIKIFINRQRILREKTNYADNNNILRIFFEDAVIDYEKTCLKIFNFLNIPSGAHCDKLKHFNPEISKKNVGLWKSATKDQLPAIRRLEKELPELCRI